MTSRGSKLLMIGLKDSGKTTYLAALWHLLESGEVADRLSVPTLQPDREYLNAIRNNWLSLKPVGRTSLRTKVTVQMNLEDNVTGSRIEVAMPDLSGESFRLQWSTRKSLGSYGAYAATCTGAFLFVHPASFSRTHAIRPRALEESPDERENEGANIAKSANWTPAQSSTQVQLTDVLQLLLGLRSDEWGMRVAVIISAWDLVKANVSPMGWLASRLPLLSQFLWSNQNWLKSEVFGVSAQGGDLITDRAKLLESSHAATRCRAVQGNQLDLVSITAPLQFLLGC